MKFIFKLSKFLFYALLLITNVFTIKHLNAQVPIDHSLFETLLIDNVHDGLVDYKSISKNTGTLDLYLNSVSNITKSEFEKWSSKAKKAFWINVYNAVTIKVITENYPIQTGGFISRIRFPQNSIRQIDKVWSKPRIKTNGKKFSLDDIEHKILRQKIDDLPIDPRIHFAIVCASISCPKLHNNVFTEKNIESLLNKLTYNFVNDNNYVKISESKLQLSPIFDWYAEDFKTENETQVFLEYDSKYHGILEFIYNSLNEKKKSILLNQKLDIEFLDYDWSLNEIRTNNKK